MVWATTTTNGLYKLENGEQFTKINVSGIDERGNFYSLLSLNGTFYLGILEYMGTGFLYKSNAIKDNVIEFNKVPGRGWKRNYGFITNFINISNGNIIYAAANTSKTTSYLYYTTDNWATCSWFSNIETLITSLAVSSNQTVFVGTKTVENKGKLYKSTSGTTFIEVPGWKENNGEVHSLLTVNDIVYIGTKTGIGQGKLFKITNDGIIHEITEWGKDAGDIGKIHSLLNIKGIIYVGTKTGVGQGKIFKSKNDNNFELIPNWDISNGEVLNLFNINNDLYVRTKVSKQISYLFRWI